MNISADTAASRLSFEDFREIILEDYKHAVESRMVSLLGRKEVLTGKAKFGIFGDGKELAQIALAKVFRKGDWRSGYYRDQTLAFATGISSIYQFFSQLYANPDVQADTSSAGRQMVSHFSTRQVDALGNWVNQTQQINSVSDISTTGGQMARAVGLGLASKLYRENPELSYLKYFSDNGNEVVYCTVGNASTSEGVFWETVNAAGVKQIPLVISIWDDGYGISVPNEIQTTKADISEALRGFQRDEQYVGGFEIFKVRGWDYPGLCEAYEKASKIAREQHIPCLVHVTEMSQPQGHSSSGSHERYKSTERLQWETEYDCNVKMRAWLLEAGLATESELEIIEKEAKEHVREEQRRAWSDYQKTLQEDLTEAIQKLAAIQNPVAELPLKALKSISEPSLKEIYSTVRLVLRELRFEQSPEKSELQRWYQQRQQINHARYNDRLMSELDLDSTSEVIDPEYDEVPKIVDGREVLNACFEANFEKDARLIAFGEDVGMIGDVNQGFAGLQEKFGEMRIFDTGIRESVIMGKGMGLAMRGLRPIAEIQYLDYLIYALPVLSDDLASLSYRTKGQQRAPMIIRTRGHRLEGIWHSGSPMSVLLGSLRGLHICVPRNMSQAAGMYNTLLKGNDPALVIECLNGYRLKEKLPSNVGEFTVPIGYAELMREGQDLTVVSYGSTLRIVQEAALELEKIGISIEVIDIQCLLPFDKAGLCAKSLEKTNRLLVVDEDVPGGASAYIMKHILEDQQGYFLLDSQPRTLCAKAHRPPYGSDGDYFTKPSVDDVVEAVYQIMNDVNPQQYPTYLG